MHFYVPYALHISAINYINFVLCVCFVLVADKLGELLVSDTIRNFKILELKRNTHSIGAHGLNNNADLKENEEKKDTTNFYHQL